jgi:hypothetical protein
LFDSVAECARKEEMFVRESRSSESLLSEKEDAVKGLERQCMDY